MKFGLSDHATDKRSASPLSLSADQSPMAHSSPCNCSWLLGGTNGASRTLLRNHFTVLRDVNDGVASAYERNGKKAVSPGYPHVRVAGTDSLGLDYDGTMIHDGWSPYDQFEKALHQQCLNHLLRRADNMAVTATRGAVCFPRRVAELLRTGLDLRDRHAAVEISRHGLAVARGRLENQLSELIFPPKTNAANERLAQHLWNHRDELFTFLREPGLDATNWRAELAIRFGVILRKVWGGSRTWVGARAQSVLMSAWRTCWQQGRSALDFLSQLLRGKPMLLGLPP